jgi:hypothetical protein
MTSVMPPNYKIIHGDEGTRESELTLGVNATEKRPGASVVTIARTTPILPSSLVDVMAARQVD